MPVAVLGEVSHALDEIGDQPGRHVDDDFIIHRLVP
jgi:hypothetical protein